MQQHLTPAELTRYSRHLLLPEVGLEGQKKLKAAKVLIAGCGGLGSPAALYLAAAGAGTIGLADYDAVDLSNLQRQILFSSESVGSPKAEAATKRLEELNPEIDVFMHTDKLDARNAETIVSKYDLVIDGTDNFVTRYLLSDVCVRLKKPYVYGSIYKFEGQVALFLPGNGCYRCLFPQMPDAGAVPNCAEIGVLGAIAGIIGVLQATEALKLIAGIGKSLSGRLLIVDALSMHFSELPLAANADCTACGAKASEHEIKDEAPACASASSLNVEPESESASVSRDLTAEELFDLINEPGGDSILLLDVRSPEEFVFCSLDNAVLIPLNDLPSRLDELDKQQHIIAYCHYGIRSRTACQILIESGFARVSNLKGGIAAWSRDVDLTVPQY